MSWSGYAAGQVRERSLRVASVAMLILLFAQVAQASLTHRSRVPGQFTYYLAGDLYSVIGTGNANASDIRRLEYAASGDVIGCLRADANCDGLVNNFDIDPFVAILVGGTPCSACAGDANCDGVANNLDIDPFVACLVGLGGAPCEPPRAPSGTFALHGRPVDVIAASAHNPGELVLMNGRARSYDVRHGRWLQRDRGAFGGRGNLYEAFSNNPTSRVDPLGLFDLEVDFTPGGQMILGGRDCDSCDWVLLGYFDRQDPQFVNMIGADGIYQVPLDLITAAADQGPFGWWDPDDAEEWQAWAVGKGRRLSGPVDEIPGIGTKLRAGALQRIHRLAEASGEHESAQDVAFVVRAGDMAGDQADQLLWFYATAPLDVLAGVKSVAQAASLGRAMQKVGRVAGAVEKAEGVGAAGAGVRAKSAGAGDLRAAESAAAARRAVEQPRNALGQFATKLGGELRPGESAERLVAQAITNKRGWKVVAEQVYVRDLATSAVRKLDVVVKGPSGRIIGVEVKSGTGVRTAAQRTFDQALNAAGGQGFEPFGTQATRFDLGSGSIERVVVIEVP